MQIRGNFIYNFILSHRIQIINADYSFRKNHYIWRYLNIYGINVLQRFILIAGPCLAESKTVLVQTIEGILDTIQNFDLEFYFKASYRKANRTSGKSFSGVGDETALNWIKEIGKEYGVKTLTDVHSVDDCELASNFVDALQIPAFLCRQTDLLIAAGKTGKVVNIKKGQFLAAKDMANAADKVASTGNNQIMLTERGTFFGYHDLVVDFRNIIIMKAIGYPVIYDATHSVQQPSIGDQSGGLREYILPLAKSAIACDVDGIFCETHPDPINAKSDAATQLKLDNFKEFFNELIKLNELTKNV